MPEAEKIGVLNSLKNLFLKEVPYPGGDVVTCVVCACASLVGAIGCYALFVFGGFGEMACFFMAFGVVMLVGQIPKQVFRAYALTKMAAGGKVYRGQQFVIYALVGAIAYAPWLVPAYGAVRAIYEIESKCVINEDDASFDYLTDSDLREELKSQKRLWKILLRQPGKAPDSCKTKRVSLKDYYINCRTMNWLSLSVYKKVYSLYFDGEPHVDNHYTQTQIKDAQLCEGISAALRKDDYKEATRLAEQVSDEELRSALDHVILKKKLNNKQRFDADKLKDVKKIRLGLDLTN